MNHVLKPLSRQDYFNSLLTGLEDENARLKRLLADAMLDNAALKDLLGKKW